MKYFITFILITTQLLFYSQINSNKSKFKQECNVDSFEITNNSGIKSHLLTKIENKQLKNFISVNILNELSNSTFYSLKCVKLNDSLNLQFVYTIPNINVYNVYVSLVNRNSNKVYNSLMFYQNYRDCSNLKGKYVNGKIFLKRYSIKPGAKTISNNGIDIINCTLEKNAYEIDMIGGFQIIKNNFDENVLCYYSKTNNFELIELTK